MMDRRSLFLREMGIEQWALRTPPPHAGAESIPAPSGADTQLAPASAWLPLQAEVAGCQACALCQTRTQTVFGIGAQPADWVIVGEAPGAEEDASGEPFVGQAGKLLDNMLASIGLRRGVQVFITNVLKCRPPGNRDPQPEEIEQCRPFLQHQLLLLQPKIILVAGRFAAQTLLSSEEAIGKLRGRVHHLDLDGRQVPLVATYHPAYLLRNPAEKAKVWADLCLARQVFSEFN
jgi:DNA polymerase